MCLFRVVRVQIFFFLLGKAISFIHRCFHFFPFPQSPRYLSLCDVVICLAAIKKKYNVAMMDVHDRDEYACTLSKSQMFKHNICWWKSSQRLASLELHNNLLNNFFPTNRLSHPHSQYMQDNESMRDNEARLKHFSKHRTDETKWGVNSD